MTGRPSGLRDLRHARVEASRIAAVLVRTVRQTARGCLGLDTWQRPRLSKEDETLVVEALPALHARGPMRALRPPVMDTLPLGIPS